MCKQSLCSLNSVNLGACDNNSTDVKPRCSGYRAYVANLMDICE